MMADGVLCAKKDFHAARHEYLKVKNLHVIKLATSLKSKGYVREAFCWQHYYWYLTPEGIEYLRQYLHLREDVVPNTIKAKNLPPPRILGERPERRDGDRPERRDRDGDRPRRRYGDDAEKKIAPAGEFTPSFGGSDRPARSFGRGGPRDAAPRDAAPRT